MLKGALGIVDWGIGGLGVYREVKARADIPVVYFSDQGFTPYGKTPGAVLGDRLDQIFRFLFAQGAAHVAIACNAASAAHPGGERISRIIPFGAAMLKAGGWAHVGLIAGRATVLSRVYRREMAPFALDLKQRVAQPLSAHVEAGNLDGADLHRDLRVILKPLYDCEAILLACTHYPVIRQQIARHVNPGCRLLDPAAAMAGWLVDHAGLGAACGEDRFFTSGDAAEFREHAKLAFEVEIETVRKVVI